MKVVVACGPNQISCDDGRGQGQSKRKILGQPGKRALGFGRGWQDETRYYGIAVGSTL